MLYSHNAAAPAPLPHRIRFAGYSGPYERPECNPKLETIDWDGTQFLVRPYSFNELQTQHAKVRQRRVELLKASDWTQITDYDLGADRDAWAAYRQALRDLADAPNPFDITWPQPPAISAE